MSLLFNEPATEMVSNCLFWWNWNNIKLLEKITSYRYWLHLLYFIEYKVHASIIGTWISQWFLATKLFLFFKNNFKRNNHFKFIHHKSYLKPYLSYLLCIVRTWISQWFLAKKIFFFFKNNYTRINHCKFIHHKSHKIVPFLSYLPSIVHREYFSIIFNVKKCALYSIKYGTGKPFQVPDLQLFQISLKLFQWFGFP